MKLTVDLPIFKSQFNDIRPDSFSNAGLKALFNHLNDDEFEDDELDVIVIDSAYAEYDIDDLPENYDIFDDEDTENWDANDYSEFLSEYTTVIPVDDNTLIIGEF